MMGGGQIQTTDRPLQESANIWLRLVVILYRLSLAGLFSFAAVQIWCPGVKIQPLPLELAVQMTALFLLGLAITTWTRINWLITSIVLLLGSLIAWIWREAWLADGINWLRDFQTNLNVSILYLTGRGNLAQIDQFWLAALATLVGTLLAYFLVARFRRPWLVLTITILMTAIAFAVDFAKLSVWLLICLGIFMTVLASSHWRLKRRLGTSINRQTAGLAVLISLALVPALATLCIASLLLQTLPPGIYYQDDLASLMLDIKEQVGGIRQLQQSVPEFVIPYTGYNNPGQLGGPALDPDRPVFTISGDRRQLLLRAAVSEVYDGGRWYRQPMEFIWRFDSSLSSAAQTSVFNLDRPNAAITQLLGADLLPEITYQIEPVSPLSIILLAGRPLGIAAVPQPSGTADPDRALVLYFNIAGALYPRDQMTQTWPYEVRSRYLDSGQPDFYEKISQLMQKVSQDAATTRSGQAASSGSTLDPGERTAYLQIPDLPEYKPGGELAELVNDQLPEDQPDWDQVQRLVQYLLKRCTYNLLAQPVPEGQEFVSWFLETREGYCVYFATALTMLCRLAGIPARYVEGYAAPAATGRSNVRMVKTSQAHAWTEVWLDPLGWVPVDATPGIGNEPNQALINARPTPVPTVTVAPTSPAQPTPLLTPRPTPAAAKTGSDWIQGLVKNKTVASYWLAAVMAGLLLLLAIWIRRRYRVWSLSHDPRWIAKSFGSGTRAGRFYWQAYQQLGHLLGRPIQADETPGLYLQAIDQLWGQQLPPAKISEVLAILEPALFSQRAIDPADLAKLEACYDDLEKLARQQVAWPRYWYHRLLINHQTSSV
jgi:transglutaminase-like putative cysteine protease